MGNFYNYIVAFASAIGGFLFGYEIGIIDQVMGMEDFQRKFGMQLSLANSTWIAAEKIVVDDIKGYITSTFLIGCVVGAILVTFLADGIGRKRSIILGGLLFTIGGAIQAGCANLEVFYVGRITSGVGIGILSMVVPMYISETAPTAVRGRMIAVQQLMITIGILCAAIINTIIRNVENGNEREWRISLAIQCVPGTILVFLMFLMPYSPRWLENRSRSDEALHSLAKLRGEQEENLLIVKEYTEIREGVEIERGVGNASWPELCKSGIINRVLIACTLQFFQQWTGINVILYYASDLFEMMGFNKEDASKKMNIINAFVNVLGTFPGMYLIERAGRRKLLIWGGFVMALSHFSVCLFVGLGKATPAPYFAYLAATFCYLFILAYSSSWGPIVWVYQSEIFPLRIRAKGTGLATFINWSMNAVIAKITPIIATKIDFYLYCIFGIFGLLMGIFCIIFVPETMGKSLEDMNELFGGDTQSNSIEAQRKAKNGNRKE